MNAPPGAVRVAFVKPSLAPYRITLLNRLNEVPCFEIRVLLSSESAQFIGQSLQPVDAQFAYEVFRTFGFTIPSKRATRAALPFSPGLWSHLSKTPYDLVVAFGWTMPNTVLALLHSKLHRRPILLWETSTPHPPGRLKQLLMPVIRSFMGAFDGAFAASSACKRYLISMGARADRVRVLPQAIDNAYFGTEADRARERRAELKKQLGITTTYVILYSGRFVPGKGLVQLLQSFTKIAETFPDVSLMYVGDGPLREELINLAKTNGLQDRVIVHPYVPTAELPKYYGLSDIFVLYSWYDTFGVVVAEAMASGLPIVTTPNVGAVEDLVRHQVNGLVIDYDDESQLTRALELLLTDHALCEEMGRQSRRIVAGWSLDTSARNFETLVMDYLPRNADHSRVRIEK